MSREDERRDRDRELWREQDLRDEDRRWDRLRDEGRRSDEVQDAWRSLRRGDTAWALNRMVGPDAAIDYLRGTGGAGGTEGTAPAEDATWPEHAFVETVFELLANVESAPRATFEAGQPDKDGDVLVRAVAVDPIMDGPLGSMWTSMRGGEPYRRELGTFWVRASLLADLPRAATTLERTAALIRDLPGG